MNVQPHNRFHAWRRGVDAFSEETGEPAGADTVLFVDNARRIITFNRSPDIYFDRSINPYRGCEHGCSYCFARPSHAYLDLSPGLDFETRIGWKPDAALLLRRELASPSYRCAPVIIGANTDAYQPVERRLQITRRILEVLAETRHPVQLITKSALIERDIDLLSELARDHLVEVMISVTTLDNELARRMEPRASRPQRRIAAISRLASAGVPVGVLFAPLIPALNDHEMERILTVGRSAGATMGGYGLLRLPLELKTLFEIWLLQHYPDRASRVMKRVADIHGGRVNDPRFGHRMRGKGIYAEIYRQRMHRLWRHLGFQRGPGLDCARFCRPQPVEAQMSLF